MGDEQLETEDFQPMWDSIADKLSGKNVVLFGSYNWNSGEYMDLWAQDAVRLGCNLVADGLAILDSPEPGSDEEQAAIALASQSRERNLHTVRVTNPFHHLAARCFPLYSSGK